MPILFSLPCACDETGPGRPLDRESDTGQRRAWMRPVGDSKAPERRPLINFALAIYIHLSVKQFVLSATRVLCLGAEIGFSL